MFFLDDEAVIDTVYRLKGGPSSAAYVGNLKIGKADIEHKVLKSDGKVR